MDYETFEPDPDDEYYDELCKAAWTRMFNRCIYDDHDDVQEDSFALSA